MPTTITATTTTTYINNYFVLEFACPKIVEIFKNI
jgi:hypothetical protein